MADAPAKTNTFIFVVLLALMLLGSAYYFSLENKQNQAVAQEPDAEIETSQAEPEASLIDTEAAIKDRILGDPNAPIKISEHSSLTCGHCGTFHKNTFKQLKEAYIDTGKAYIVFSDFPLNAPALHASMTARCLPEDKYFDFVQMLFETQEDWAFDTNYMAYLKTKAGENSLDSETFDACVKNVELQQGIVKRMKAAQKQWRINSTPTFVINNEHIANGAMPFEEFEKVINKELAK